MTTPRSTPGPQRGVNIVDDLLSGGKDHGVTFSFSEKVTGFDEGSLPVVGGTVTDLKSTDGGQTWTGNLSPRPRAIPGSASVTVNNGSYTDLNGNVGPGQHARHRDRHPGPERGGQHC
ncbi:Ig-like domain-containing protein [Aeromonas veronii]|uniref:Ig-like domain-containing protein n=1 Tax=Aeromonas veronii TaxID=654 RepID=UPI001FFEEE14|nr:Ig-like domain-containing protein [Aeromonas veronii]UPK54800.1 Ig-like domain-containing protein [Aeromonas veronii]